MHASDFAGRSSSPSSASPLRRCCSSPRCSRCPCPSRPYRRIEQSLRSEAHLVADVLVGPRARHRAPRRSTARPVGSARRSPARVTFIAGRRHRRRRFDGERRGAGRTRESRDAGPEVAQARARTASASRGATARRCRPTCSTSPCRSTTRGCAVVRLALPLTEVQQQVASVRRHHARRARRRRWSARWRSPGSRRRCSAGASRRLRRAARRVASGDLSQRVRDYERDETRHRGAASSTTRCASWRAARRSSRRTGRAPTPSCGHGRRRDGGQQPGPRAARQPAPRARCSRSTRRAWAGTTSRRCGIPAWRPC